VGVGQDCGAQRAHEGCGAKGSAHAGDWQAQIVPQVHTNQQTQCAAGLGEHEAGLGEHEAGPGEHEAGPGEREAEPGEHEAGPGEHEA
jgi:hypothetical protein